MERQFKFLYACIYFAIGALYSFIVLYMEEAGFTGVQTGTVMAMGSLVLIFSQPFWGIVCDKSRKTILVLRLTLVLAGVVSLSLLTTTHVGLFLVLYSLMHFFQGANAPITDTLAINLSRDHESSFGVFRQYGAIGFAVAVLVTSQASEAFGLWMVFPLYALAYFVGALSFRPSSYVEGVVVSDLISALRTLVRIPRYRMMLLCTFFVFGPVVANNNYFGLLFIHAGGSVAGVGLAFLLFSGSEAPFMKASGMLIRKMGMENMLIAASLVASCRWFWYSTGPAPSLMLALFLLQGFSVGIYIVGAAQYVAENAIPSLQVTAMTIYSSVGIGMGGIFCQMMGGILLDVTGINSVYLFFSGSTLVGAGLLVVLKGLPDHRCEEHPV